MTVEEILYKLKNDFSFLVNVVVSNNPDDVRRNLSQIIDGNYESVDSMINVIMQLHEVGQDDLVRKALNVPFISSNASPNLLSAWEQLKLQANSSLSTARTTDPTLAIPTGGYTGVSGSEQYATGGSGGGFASWSGGLFDMVGQIGSAWIGASSGQQTTQPGSYYVAPQQQPQKSNTIWWIIGAIVLVILVVVMIFMFKKD